MAKPQPQGHAVPVRRLQPEGGPQGERELLGAPEQGPGRVRDGNPRRLTGVGGPALPTGRARMPSIPAAPLARPALRPPAPSPAQSRTSILPVRASAYKKYCGTRYGNSLHPRHLSGASGDGVQGRARGRAQGEENRITGTSRA